MKKIALNVSGKTIYKSIKFKKQKEFREKAILNRTKSEIEAQSILEKHFVLHKDFNIEFWFQFRRFDFFFPLIRTVIEIDGGYHDTHSQKEYDNATDKYLKQKHSINVIRIKNKDVGLCLEKICLSLVKLINDKKNNVQLEKTNQQIRKHKIKEELRYKKEIKYHQKVIEEDKRKKDYERKKAISESRKYILRKAKCNLK